MSIPMMSYGLGALRSIDSMRQNGNLARRAMERLATGLQINSAEDDPSGNALARGHFQNRLGRIQAGIENLEMAAKFADLRWEGLTNTRDAMYRLKDLLVRAANDATLTAADRTNIQVEIDGLLDSIDDNRNITFKLDNNPGGTYTMYNPGMLDVVWVFDGTGSMSAYHADAAIIASDMYDGFKANGFDLQMAAVGYEGTGKGAYPVAPGSVTLGGPIDAILKPNGWSLVDNAIAFGTQATNCGLAGGDEMGMDAIVEAVMQFTDPGNPNGFREGAQKVILLVTDADSDDQGAGANSFPAGDVDVAASIEQQAIDALNAAGIIMMYAGNLDELNGGPNTPTLTYDTDYANIAAATGGASILLDTYRPTPTAPGQPGTVWVTQVTNQLQAFGGPWENRYQWGPENGDYLEYTFNTVVPMTMGIAGLNASSAATAQNSLDALDEGFIFLNDAMVETGSFRGLIERTMNTQMAEYSEVAAMTSHLTDTDLAAEITIFARASITQDAAVATLSHAFQSIKNLMTLMDKSLPGSVPSGSGQSTAAQSSASSGLGAPSLTQSSLSSTDND